MYDLSRYSFSQLFEATDESLTRHLLPECPVTLSMADIQRLCLGKEANQQHITTLITAMGNVQSIRQPPASSRGRGSPFSNVCISAAACRKDFAELVDLATQHYLFDRERGYCDPLYVAEELGQLKSAEFSECKACGQLLETWATKEREKIWKMLASWFRLE